MKTIFGDDRFRCEKLLLVELLRSKFIPRLPRYKIVGEWLGEGLFLASGAKWKKRRAHLTHAFHFSILNSFIDIYKKHAEKFVDKLNMLCASNPSEEIEVQHLFSLVLLDVICETSMGVR